MSDNTNGLLSSAFDSFSNNVIGIDVIDASCNVVYGDAK